MMDKCFYCDAGPFEDVKGWALHKCKSKYDLANDNKQLRERIAELEGRTCERCYHNDCCSKDTALINGGNILPLEITGCSAFEPKKEDKP